MANMYNNVLSHAINYSNIGKLPSVIRKAEKFLNETRLDDHNYLGGLYDVRTQDQYRDLRLAGLANNLGRLRSNEAKEFLKSTEALREITSKWRRVNNSLKSYVKKFSKTYDDFLLKMQQFKAKYKDQLNSRFDWKTSRIKGFQGSAAQLARLANAA